MVHELAHAWDAQTAGLLQRIVGGEGQLARGMREFVGEEPGPTWYGSGDPSVTSASCPVCEEWAESVAAYLYPEYIESLTDQTIRDERFIQRETGWAPAPYQRPGLDVLHRRYIELQFQRVRESQR